MADHPPDKSFKRLYLWILVLALILHVWELDDISLWFDEAETIRLAQAVLERGVPRLEVSTVSEWEQHMVSSRGLWLIQPWVQFYFTAPLLVLFGKNLFLLRLPFALIGVACVALLMKLAERLTADRMIPVYSGLILACNVPFILLNRTIRYYSISVFFSLLLLLCYVDLRRGKKRWMAFILSAILLLHTFYLPAIALLAVFSCDILVDKGKRGLFPKLAGAYALILLGFLPFLLPTLTIVHNYQQNLQGGVSLVRSGEVAMIHLLHLVKFNFPLLLLPLLLLPPWRSMKDRAFRSQDVWLMCGIILALCLVAGLGMNQSLNPQYTYAALPLLALLSAALIRRISGGLSLAEAGLLLILLLSNALSLPYWPFLRPGPEREYSYLFAPRDQQMRIFRRSLVNSKIDFLLPKYFRELSTDYVGPTEALSNFLRAESSPDAVFFTPADRTALTFLTGLKAVSSLPFEKPPEWIIPRRKSRWSDGLLGPKKTEEEVTQYLKDFFARYRYVQIELEAPDLWLENFPAPPFHHYWTTPRNRPRLTVLHFQPA